MKISSIILATVLATASVSQAAVTLGATSFQNGLSDSTGAALAANAISRYGYFGSGFDFGANANDIAALETAFTQVTSQTGVQAFGIDGFFQYTLNIDDTASFEGQNYNSQIVGKNIYAWVMNNTNPASATQHGIFSTSETWNDSSNPNMTFTLQSNVPGGVNTRIGSALTGPVLFTGLGNSYQLADIGVVPEPSRAMLGLLGLGALVFRRRR
jgi:MYXO-CTERM domain-containing protein